MGYQRFVVVGDSCAEGLHDPYPGSDVYRGWADLAAAALARSEPELRYANLAVRGRRLDQIIIEQIPAALDLRPDLVALFGGANDVMTRTYRAEVVAKRVDAAIRMLTRSTPTVIVFTLSDVSGRVPALFRIRHRLEAINAAINASANRHGAEVIDLWGEQTVHDLRYFGPDRLHLSEYGHRRLAAYLLTRLGVPHDPAWLAPPPGEPVRPGVCAHARWVWREVLPAMVTRTRNWFTGRSIGDGIAPKRPELSPVLTDELVPWKSIPGSA